MKREQAGFGHLVLLLAVVILVAVGLAGWRVWQTNHKTSKPPTNNTVSTQKSSSNLYNWQPAGAAFASSLANGLRNNYADSAVLDMGNGQFRMYYNHFTEPSNGYGQQMNNPTIDSATSTDGIHWTADQGDRIKNCLPYKQHLFKSGGGVIRFYTSCGVWNSTDGLNFSKIGDISLPQISGQLGQGPADIVRLSDGRYRAYRPIDFVATDPQHRQVKVYSYISTDGLNFSTESGTRFDTCATLGNDSYKLRDTLMVESSAQGWTMYLPTDGNCATSPNSSGQLPTPLSPSAIVASSTDGLTWQTIQTTGLLEAEPYFSLKLNGFASMSFGYCYNPNQSQPPSLAGNPIYTKYPGCSLLWAKL